MTRARCGNGVVVDGNRCEWKKKIKRTDFMCFFFLSLRPRRSNSSRKLRKRARSLRSRGETDHGVSGRKRKTQAFGFLYVVFFCSVSNFTGRRFARSAVYWTFFFPLALTFSSSLFVPFFLEQQQ